MRDPGQAVSDAGQKLEIVLVATRGVHLREIVTSLRKRFADVRAKWKPCPILEDPVLDIAGQNASGFAFIVLHWKISDKPRQFLRPWHCIVRLVNVPKMSGGHRPFFRGTEFVNQFSVVQYPGPDQRLIVMEPFQSKQRD